MKNIFFILVGAFLFSMTAYGQLMGFHSFAGHRVIWTWISGANTSNAVGTYGSTASALNTPTARGYGCSVKDTAGNFWLFGGYDYSGSNARAAYWNDLWKYDTTTNMWTWVSGDNTNGSLGSYPGTSGGTGSTSYRPSARRDPGCWFAAGKFWMFGGYVDATSATNELWSFDPATGIWTWVTGNTTGDYAGVYGTLGTVNLSNSPPARRRMATWNGPGNTLWFFGGESGLGFRNDLWRFDIATSKWTWMSGLNGTGGTATYGTQGVADSANVPSARRISGASAAIDSQGNFWFFGGEGASSAYYNDLWKYDPVTNWWTWVAGANTTNQAASGSLLVRNPNNHPGARSGSVLGINNQDIIYIFGGYKVSPGELNDFWTYTPSSNQWIWVGGTPLGNQSASYGTLGVRAVTNTPNGRDAMATWTDSNGDLWIFGGATTAAWGDLWKASVH